jgi:hypothetical protein
MYQINKRILNLKKSRKDSLISNESIKLKNQFLSTNIEEGKVNKKKSKNDVNKIHKKILQIF